MFCARCGEQIPDASATCPLCGRDATIGRLPQPKEPSNTGTTPTQMRQLTERPINSNLKGIGGWLLFFCVIVTILSPLAILLVLIRAMAGQFTFNVWILGILATAVLSFVTGLSVWMVSSHALNMVRAYFLVLGGYALFSLSYTAASGLVESTDIIVANTRSLIFVIVWAAYFHKSKRVRATFGRNL